MLSDPFDDKFYNARAFKNFFDTGLELKKASTLLVKISNICSSVLSTFSKSE